MFENRGPHMVENDYTPLSALDIFVKDLVRLIYTQKLVFYIFHWKVSAFGLFTVRTHLYYCNSCTGHSFSWVLISQGSTSCVKYCTSTVLVRWADWGHLSVPFIFFIIFLFDDKFHSLLLQVQCLLLGPMTIYTINLYLVIFVEFLDLYLLFIFDT